MIRLMHLITTLNIGGAETMLYKLLSHMNRLRFRNVVVSMTDLGVFGSRIEAMGIPVFTLGVRRRAPNPIGLWRLLQLLHKERPQILQTWLYHSDLLGLLAGKLARVPAIVWNLRCSDMDMRNYSTLSALVVSLLSKLSSIPEVVLVNSESGQQLHQKMGYNPRRWVLIPNGFDLDHFHPDPVARMTFRQELELSNDAILIGLVARFDPMKDHANFLQAALSLLKDYTNVHFVLVGSDVDQNNIELVTTIAASGNKKHFHLLGERSDIPYILATLDIATSSSSYGEGFPNVIGEAMTCGVPSVVTDVGDSTLIVGNTGSIVPPKDPQALAEAWSKLIDMGPANRCKLGAAARHRIEKHFNLSTVVSRYEVLYEEVVSQVRSNRARYTLGCN